MTPDIKLKLGRYRAEERGKRPRHASGLDRTQKPVFYIPRRSKMAAQITPRANTAGKTISLPLTFLASLELMAVSRSRDKVNELYIKHNSPPTVKSPSFFVLS